MSRREKIRLEAQMTKKKKIRVGRIFILLLIIVMTLVIYKCDLISKAILIINPIIIDNIEVSVEKKK